MPEVKGDFWSFASVFMIVSNCGSILHVFMARVVWLVIFAIFIVQVLRRRVHVSANLVVALIVIWLISFTSALVTCTSVSCYNGVFVGSLLALLVIGSCGNNCQVISDNIYRSCRIVSYLGILNVILYLFFPSFFVYLINESGFGINTILFVFNYQNDEIIRNQGLYWEPGVFQVLLNIYLFIMLVERRYPYKKAILPIFLIISTFSTTGLIIMSLILFCSFVKRKKTITPIKKIFLVSFFAILLSPIVYNNVIEKFSSDKSPSSALRTYDFFMGLNIIKDNPLWGVGMDPQQFSKRARGIDIIGYDTSVLNINRGNTNAIISIAMMLGVPVLLLFVITMYRQKLFLKRKLFFCVIFVSLFSEPLFPFPLLFLLCLSSIINPSNLKSYSIN